MSVTVNYWNNLIKHFFDNGRLTFSWSISREKKISIWSFSFEWNDTLYILLSNLLYWWQDFTHDPWDLFIQTCFHQFTYLVTLDTNKSTENSSLSYKIDLFCLNKICKPKRAKYFCIGYISKTWYQTKFRLS